MVIVSKDNDESRIGIVSASICAQLTRKHCSNRHTNHRMRAHNAMNNSFLPSSFFILIIGLAHFLQKTCCQTSLTIFAMYYKLRYPAYRMVIISPSTGKDMSWVEAINSHLSVGARGSGGEVASAESFYSKRYMIS